MNEKFISEPVQPVPGTMNIGDMATGEPGLPNKFVWRGQEYIVAEVLRKWKQLGGCVSGSGEQYVRKHWYKIRTTMGIEMTLYFERQARPKRRWWLFTITE